MENVTWWIAFGAGFLSFVSPCTLPLFPSYLSYITGISVSHLNQSQDIKRVVILHTLFFLLGFSIVFYALGYTASWIGNFFIHYQQLLRMVGGILLIAIGIFMLGLYQPTFLLKERRWTASNRKWGYLGSIFIGISFAAGWTPCLGPILAAILYMAALKPELAFFHITAYNLGFSIPFILMAFFVGRMKWLSRYSERVMNIGGLMMILIGVLLYTNQFTTITSWLTKWAGGFQGY